MVSKTAKVIAIFAILFAVFAVLLLGVRGYNNLWNNADMDGSAYQGVSYATGLGGHVEYIKYSDGPRDVKVYPGVGHRLWDSDLFQDTDGDGKIDIIRRNGAEWKMNSLIELLVRQYDYEAHKERFDNADALLEDLMKRYPLQKGN